MISEAVHLSGKRPEAERAMAVFEAGQNPRPVWIRDGGGGGNRTESPSDSS